MSLKEAKIGDRLIVSNRWNEFIDQVVAITKAGNIKTHKKGIYAPSGRQRGGGKWDSFYAYTCSDEEYEKFKLKVRKHQLVGKLSAIEWKDISLEELEKISEIINLDK